MLLSVLGCVTSVMLQKNPCYISPPQKKKSIKSSRIWTSRFYELNVTHKSVLSLCHCGCCRSRTLHTVTSSTGVNWPKQLNTSVYINTHRWPQGGGGGHWALRKWRTWSNCECSEPLTEVPLGPSKQVLVSNIHHLDLDTTRIIRKWTHRHLAAQIGLAVILLWIQSM